MMEYLVVDLYLQLERQAVTELEYLREMVRDLRDCVMWTTRPVRV